MSQILLEGAQVSITERLEGILWWGSLGKGIRGVKLTGHILRKCSFLAVTWQIDSSNYFQPISLVGSNREKNLLAESM